MSIIRPPITGDNLLDSWMHQVTQSIISGGGSVTVASVTNTGSVTPPSGGGSGVNAITLILYKRTDLDTLPAGENIQTNVEYTYSTGALNIPQPDGWSRFYPPLSEGRSVWAIQVNITDTADVEFIPATAWSAPILIQDRDDVIDVRIATDNGTALRPSGNSQTTMKAVVSRNGTDQSDTAHNGYKYTWSIPSGEVVCVDSNRNVINDGANPLLATGTPGALVCSIGTPASGEEPADTHGSMLRSIKIGSEDVDKSQPILLEVSNIPD